MISQITFRTDRVFTAKFGRDEVEPLSGHFELWQRFQVERYLEHHGDKLIRRFDANSYLLLTKAMDLHDLGRGRGGMDAALARIHAPVLAVGISSDTLYPTYQSRDLARALADRGHAARYAEIDSPHGHDGFLIELDQVADLLAPVLAEVAKP
jgi:homoserine O-acetyltransferase